MILTSTSCRVLDTESSAEVSPQPITLASLPVNKEDTDDGRQIGAATEDGKGAIGAVRIKMEKS